MQLKPPRGKGQEYVNLLKGRPILSFQPVYGEGMSVHSPRMGGEQFGGNQRVQCWNIECLNLPSVSKREKRDAFDVTKEKARFPDVNFVLAKSTFENVLPNGVDKFLVVPTEGDKFTVIPVLQTVVLKDQVTKEMVSGSLSKSDLPQGMALQITESPVGVRRKIELTLIPSTPEELAACEKRLSTLHGNEIWRKNLDTKKEKEAFDEACMLLIDACCSNVDKLDGTSHNSPAEVLLHNSPTPAQATLLEEVRKSQESPLPHEEVNYATMLPAEHGDQPFGPREGGINRGALDNNRLNMGFKEVDSAGAPRTDPTLKSYREAASGKASGVSEIPVDGDLLETPIEPKNIAERIADYLDYYTIHKKYENARAACSISLGINSKAWDQPTLKPFLQKMNNVEKSLEISDYRDSKGKSNLNEMERDQIGKIRNNVMRQHEKFAINCTLGEFIEDIQTDLQMQKEVFAVSFGSQTAPAQLHWAPDQQRVRLPPLAALNLQQPLPPPTFQGSPVFGGVQNPSLASSGSGEQRPGQFFARPRCGLEQGAAVPPLERGKRMRPEAQTEGAKDPKIWKGEGQRGRGSRG